MEHIDNIIYSVQHIYIPPIRDLWLALGIILAAIILSFPLAYIIVKMFNFRVKSIKKIKQHSFYKPLRIFFVLLGVYGALYILDLPYNIFDTVTTIFRISCILLAAVAIANLFNASTDTYSNLLEKFHIKGTGTTLTFLGKIIKILIYIIAGFMILTDLGYDLGGLATGLGISSVVIALATQDIARSFLGGLSILADKPFEIGDTIETGTFTGTVEDITIRTTRLRDVHNQIVIVPNSRIMDSFIINLSKKEKRRFNLPLTIKIDTPLEKISELEKKLQLALETHKDIIQDSIRVSLNNIASNKIEILINFYTDITESAEYANFKEDLNFVILEIVNESEIILV